MAKWRFMLCGGVGAGKTTLLRAIEGDASPARKTQAIEYSRRAIDTPGEYAELGRFRNHLAATASDAQLLLVVQDATRARASFPPNYFSQFTRSVIGVVTKIDAPGADLARATALLREVGVAGAIIPTSAITGSGLSPLRQALLSASSTWKE